eukprot:TRINITY_DN3614_c0_g1_i2.p1 TRINITY_DN3614_c0_g1~~TRINITY_DN3614_c0_g1_i2.p1  ORF type:complete len:717 (+),score=122.65 TRINITY_DN3614_c0_g1_i2:57-2207(+)
MKFAQALKSHAVAEWQTQYVNYKKLKKQVKKIVLAERAAVSDSADTGVWVESGKHIPEQTEFVRLLEDEADKVDKFYKRRQAAVESRLLKLLQQAEGLGIRTNRKTHSLEPRSRTFTVKAGLSRRTALRQLRQAFTEFYRELGMIKSFVALNAQGFAKGLKKHDKNTKWRATPSCMPLIEDRAFYKHEGLDVLLKQTEEFYSRAFANGDRHKAMRDLRVIVRRYSSPQVFFLGLFLGLSIPGLLMIIGSIVANPTFENLLDTQAIISVYRGSGLFILFIFLFGANVGGWVKARINHVFIFELDPRSPRTAVQLYIAASFLLLLWTWSLYAYLLGTRSGVILIGIPPWAYPLAFVCVIAGLVFLPLPICGRDIRYWSLRRVGRIATAPFFPVEFADFFLADQLASLVVMLYDLEYVICFYTADLWWGTDRCLPVNIYVRPVLACLPALWRALQCIRRFKTTGDKFPHLVNMMKYITNCMLVVFGSIYRAYPDNIPLTVVWALNAVIAMVYSYLWDVCVDWSVVKLCPFKLLRPMLAYEPKGWYYLAIISNLILRSGWVFTMTPLVVAVHPELYLAIFAVAEVVRRFQWNFYRMENEHLNNVGQYRATLQVPLPLEVNEVGPTSDDEHHAISRETSELDLQRRDRSSTTLSAMSVGGGGVGGGMADGGIEMSAFGRSRTVSTLSLMNAESEMHLDSLEDEDEDEGAHRWQSLLPGQTR